MQSYRKLIVAVIGAALTWAIAAYAGNPDVSHWLGLASALLTAAGVYIAPNDTPAADGGMAADT